MSPHPVVYDQIPTHDVLGDCSFLQLPLDSVPRQLPDPAEIDGPIMVDTETSALYQDDGGRVSTVSVAFPAPRDTWGAFEFHEGISGAPAPHGEPRRYITVAYPFGQGPEDDLRSLPKTEWRVLMRFLQQAGAGLVGHNLRFDLLHLAGRNTRGWPGLDLTERALNDTMVSAFEIDPLGSLALKKLATELFDEDADQEQQALGPHLGPKRDPRFDLVPWEVMHPYARRDVELTAALFEHQQDILDQNTLAGAYLGREMNILRALSRMELAGMPYDVEYSLRLAGQLQSSMDEIARSLPFKPTPQGSQKYFYGPQEEGGLDLTPTVFTATGRPSAASPVVRRLADQSVPHAADLARYNAYKSAVSKWYNPFAHKAGPDGRIRTSFRHTGGTRSERFSSSRINLQAVPQNYSLNLPVASPRDVIAKRVREAMPGWALYETDLMQAELRLAAMDAGVDLMLDALRDGRDVHGETAKQLFDVDPGHADWDHFRGLAKRANFSLLFSAGPDTFQRMLADGAGLQMSIQEVRQLVYAWRDLYPQFGQQALYWESFVKRHNYVPTIDGRKRWYAPGEDHFSGHNQRIQSSLAQFVKNWVIYADRLSLAHALPARGQHAGVGRAGLLLTVHDSLVFLLPEDEGPEFMQMVDEDTARLWGEFFPGVPGGSEYERWD